MTFSPKGGKVHAAAAWRQQRNEVFIDLALGAPQEKKADKRQRGYALDILAGVVAAAPPASFTKGSTDPAECVLNSVGI